MLEDRLQQVEALIQSKADIQHVVSLEIVLDTKAEKVKLERLEQKVLHMSSNNTTELEQMIDGFNPS